MNTHEAIRRQLLKIAFAVMLALSLVLGSKTAAAQSCERLADLKLANTSITTSQSVGAGVHSGFRLHCAL